MTFMQVLYLLMNLLQMPKWLLAEQRLCLCDNSMNTVVDETIWSFFPMPLSLLKKSW